MIGTVVSGIIDLGKSFFKRKTEKTKALHERDLAVINNQARLAMSKQEANAAWEMATLQDKDKFLRRFSFFMLTSAVMAPVVSPEYGTLVYQRLSLAPEWLITIYFSVLSAVWGLAELKNSIPQLVAGWREGKKKT